MCGACARTLLSYLHSQAHAANGMCAEGVLTAARSTLFVQFLLVYDETWLLVHQLRTLLLLTSGNRLSFDFSIFYIASDGGCGWPPHRDRGGDSTGAFRADGTPQYVTTWIALSEASPASSCLYVVPKGHDPGYAAGEPPGASPISGVLNAGGEAALQHVRALPCAPGGVVQFSHRLLHWGSAAQSGPAHAWRPVPPRVALSFAAVDDRFETPFLSRDSAGLPLPPLPTRLALVGALALLYTQHAPPPPVQRRLYWDLVHASRECFEPAFYDLIARNRHKEGAGATQADGGYGAAGGGTGSGTDGGTDGGADGGGRHGGGYGMTRGGAAAEVVARAGAYSKGIGELGGEHVPSGGPAPLCNGAADGIRDAVDGTYLMFPPGSEALRLKLAALERKHASGLLSTSQYEKAVSDVRVARLIDPTHMPLRREDYQ